jgi:spermidine/putrescine transport system permease protein
MTTASAPGIAPARRRRRVAVVLLLGPAVLLVGGALLIPTINLLVQSFLVPSGYGQVSYHFTFANYSGAVTNPTYLKLAMNSFGLGAFAAITCLVLGYPVAFFISFRLTRGKNMALFLVVASLFSSYLVRLYAWYTILGEHGVINSALIHLGIIGKPLMFLLFSRWAVLTAFVNIFLPYTILMLTSAMQNIHRDLLENARDLGASPLLTFSRIVLPLSMTGAIGALIYTFILTSGDYITPALLGGTQSTALANVVSDQFLALGDRPEGAAISFVMLAVFFCVYLALTRLERFKGL